jgi:hypothetical protein
LIGIACPFNEGCCAMPSRAVDEAWHGLILCTARYSAFCTTAYGQFLHHHPDGGAPAAVAALTDSIDEQLRRTVIAWSLVATPGEQFPGCPPSIPHKHRPIGNSK